MEQEKIRELLDRYNEGNTTEEEELLLKAVLSDPSLPLSLRTEAACLAGMTPRVPEPSEEFLERLESVTRVRSVNMPGYKGLRLLIGTAASIIVLTGSYLFFTYLSGREMHDTFQDPEIAMAEVKSVLMSVSEKMTRAAEPLGSINAMTSIPEPLEGMGKINSILGRNLSKLRYLDQVAGTAGTNENN
jgi:hypothetical protein